MSKKNRQSDKIVNRDESPDVLAQQIDNVVTIKMYNENERVKTADVHPDEVENLKKLGWVEI